MFSSQINEARKVAFHLYQMTLLAWSAHSIAFCSLFLLQVAQGVLPAVFAWITKQIFDLIVLEINQSSISNIWYTAIGLLVAHAFLSLLKQVSEHMNVYLNGELNRSITLKTQSMVYGKIGELDGLIYFETPKFHDVTRLASQGAQMGAQQMLSVLTGLIQSVTLLLAFTGVILVFSPFLGALIALVSLPYLYAQMKIGRKRVALSFLNSPKERQAYYYGRILTEPYFAKEVRLFRLASYFLDKFRRTSKDIHSTQRKMQAQELRWNLGLSLLSNVVSGGSFAVVAVEALLRRITIGDLTLYTNALANIQGAISRIIFSLASLNEYILYYPHFTHLLSLPPALAQVKQPQSVPQLQSAIEIRDLSFRYTEDHPYILKNFDLNIPAGKCLALVGLNGAGKTTLVKLLMRLYDPTKGQILWNGTDIREFELGEYRQRIGAIFQDYSRFDLSARENIGIGDIRYVENLSKIRQAAIKAGVDRLIEKLPNSYDTILSRWLSEDVNGVDLSGGEWQKIAAARMFMRETDFLILDEPTAALDAEAEHEIFNYFVELASGRTTLLISHRFSTVRMADIIAVLEESKIAEYGSHSELMALKGTYAQLYNLQANQFSRG